MINGNTDDDFWIMIIFICYFRGGIVVTELKCVCLCVFMFLIYLISNKNIIMSSFKSSGDIQKKEGGPDSCFG